jgi:hypothetical protein
MDCLCKTAGIEEILLDEREDIPVPPSPGQISDCLTRLVEAENTLASVRNVMTSLLTHIEGAEAPEQVLARVSAGRPSGDCPIDTLNPEDGISFHDSEAEDALLEGEDIREATRTQLSRQHSRNLAELETIVPAISTKLNVPEEEVMKIGTLFVDANKSGTGRLTMDELQMLLVDMCDGIIEQNQLDFIMEKFDNDKDGSLRMEEFVVAFMHTPLMRAGHLGMKAQKTEDAKSNIAEHGLRLQSEDWIEIMGCKASSVRRYVQKELDEAGSCLAMPFVFLMFILYWMSFSLHLDQEALHAVDNAFSFDIKENANFAFGGDFPYENPRMGHKSIYDVNSIADFWSFFDLGLVPIFWAEDWELSETRTNVLHRCSDPNLMFTNIVGTQRISAIFRTLGTDFQRQDLCAPMSHPSSLRGQLISSRMLRLAHTSTSIVLLVASDYVKNEVQYNLARWMTVVCCQPYTGVSA